ncbi:hypothetical protein [Pelagibacterium sediminicola]|uniref:hypothetical protein n=1 Tax=Pelagibacterium sediminicola TaxID=2248761 RepID=UPI0013009053|nr:hypothetical protein [Pelagibacterium sediminicola]
MIYRIYVSNGYDFEWTPHTVEARSVFEARKIWAGKGAPSETLKFRVSLEREAA